MLSPASRRSILTPVGFEGALASLLPRAAEVRAQQVFFTRRAMACEFSVLFPAGFAQAIPAGFAALDEVDRLEEKLSAYIEESDISRLNREAFHAPVMVDRELFDLLALAARLHASTGGAFDIAAGALVRAWGFFTGPKRVPDASELAAAREACGMAYVALDYACRRVRYLRPGIEINLGSIGKGYAIDRAIRVITDRFGSRCALIEGGRSSLRALGAPPGEPRGWKVALGDPFRSGAALATVFLKDRALGTSGAAHQFFIHNGQRYGHVLDPRSGWPANTLASASALAPTAAEADALSTAFFVLGVDETRRYCREHPEIGAILVTPPGERRRPRLIVIGNADIAAGPNPTRGES